METTALERIDSYPYRHRLADVMKQPVVTLPADGTVRAAIEIMTNRRIGAIVIADDRGIAIGIFTERDVLRVAAAGDAMLARPLASVMSSPVEGLPADAFLYRAIARMDRRDIRHLAVLDAQGRAIGMVSGRNLLHQRATAALKLGDEIDIAADAAALAHAHRGLPELARALIAEGVPASGIAAVISAVIRDMTARAAALAAEAMRGAGQGDAPAPWSLLVLGSAGRGESLLAPDQDNALIHTGTDVHDIWFAAFAERLNAMLDAAGIPFCKGKVMAKNPAWRHTPQGWAATVANWIAHPEGEALLNVDIFFDFRCMAGEVPMADALRQHALQLAQPALPFLRLLAANAENLRAPLGLFGGFKTEAGRIDLKKGGLLPIVTAARVMALKFGISATGTDDRLRAATHHLPEADNLEALVRARGIIAAAILDQQLADLAAGRAPGNHVDPSRFDRNRRAELKQALRDVASAETLIRDALTA